MELLEYGTEHNRTRPVSLIMVEDDDGDAKAVRRAFAKARISNPMLRATDGVDALELLNGENGRETPPKPYIFLVDINMPRMNGIEFIAALREDPNLRDSVVFVLTTSKRDEDMTAAYGLNVAGYIVKQTAGTSMVPLVEMLDCYWRLVELPC